MNQESNKQESNKQEFNKQESNKQECNIIKFWDNLSYKHEELNKSDIEFYKFIFKSIKNFIRIDNENLLSDIDTIKKEIENKFNISLHHHFLSKEIKSFIKTLKSFESIDEYSYILKQHPKRVITGIIILLGCLTLQYILLNKIDFNFPLFFINMSYLYTDTYIDDPQINIMDKKRYIKMLEKKLNGELSHKNHTHSHKLNVLIHTIQTHFPRDTHPSIYIVLNDLLAIQKKELYFDNNFDNDHTIYDYLKLAFDKGSKVNIAIIKMILGENKIKHKLFFSIYGFYFQMLDDLLDIQEDLESNNNTFIIRWLKEHGNIDEVVLKIISMNKYLIEYMKKNEDLHQYIKKYLILFDKIHSFSGFIILSIAFRQKEYISMEFTEKIKESILEMDPKNINLDILEDYLDM